MVMFTGMFMAFGRVEHLAANRPRRAGLAGGGGRLPGRRPRHAINGEPIRSFEDLQQATMLSTGLPMTFVVDRSGQRCQLHGDAAGHAWSTRARSASAAWAISASPRRAIPKDVEVSSAAGPINCAAWGAATGLVHRQGDAAPISAACSPAANRPTRCRA